MKEMVHHSEFIYLCGGRLIPAIGTLIFFGCNSSCVPLLVLKLFSVVVEREAALVLGSGMAVSGS